MEQIHLTELIIEAYRSRLRAIVARIDGEWDNPHLIAMGDLPTDPLDDIHKWADIGSSPKQPKPKEGNNMKLWLLEPITPWDTWYDKVGGFVIRAKSEKAARQLATTEQGDEGEVIQSMSKPWEDPTITTCKPLLRKGKTCIILRDFMSA